MPDWTREYFERGYAQRWGLPAPSDHVRLQAGSLWNLLQLSPTSRVIDIGCGHGRHALALAKRGAGVIGLDFAVAPLRWNNVETYRITFSQSFQRLDPRDVSLRVVP